MPAPSNGLGYLPDEVDTRDHRWGSPLRGRGTSASLEPYVLNVLNQGQLGSCVANAGYQAIRAVAKARGVPMRAEVDAIITAGLDALGAP